MLISGEQNRPNSTGNIQTRMSGTACRGQVIIPYTINPRPRIKDELWKVSIFRSLQLTRAVSNAFVTPEQPAQSLFLLLGTTRFRHHRASSWEISFPFWAAAMPEERRSSILPHPQPLTPLLNHTPSPTSTFFFPIFPSTHNPLSRAHLLVVPRFPPDRAVGVTHLSPRQKYGVVILPSMISPSSLTSKISSIGELEAERGRRERAVT